MCKVVLLGAVLVFKCEIDGRHDSYLLDVGSVLIAIVDGEYALRGVPDLAEFAFGVLCELLRCGAGVLGRAFYHLRLYVVKPCKFVRGVVVVDDDAHVNQVDHFLL